MEKERYALIIKSLHEHNSNKQHGESSRKDVQICQCKQKQLYIEGLSSSEDEEFDKFVINETKE